MKIKTMQDLADKHAPIKRNLNTLVSRQYSENQLRTRKQLGAKGLLVRDAKKAEQANKSTSKTDCGISAKEASDQRNREYWEKVNAGLIDDNPPMPDVIKALMIRDDLDRPI